MKHKKGFTLIEVIVTVGIISLFIGMSIPFLQKVKVKNDLRSATVLIVQWLRRAQILAQSGSDDLNAGIYIRSEDMTVFRGDSYISRLNEFDDVYSFPSSVTLDGIQEIIFEKVTGYPNTTGPIIIVTSNEGQSNTINLSGKGIIEY